MAKFTMLLAYAIAVLFALAAAGVVPVFRIATFSPQDLFFVRAVAGVLVLLTIVGWHFLSGPSLDPRDAFDRHAWAMFAVLTIASWLAFIYVEGEGLYQPLRAAAEYAVARWTMSGMRYFTPLQAEIDTLARWMLIIGMLGSAVTGWRISARRR